MQFFLLAFLVPLVYALAAAIGSVFVFAAWSVLAIAFSTIPPATWVGSFAVSLVLVLLRGVVK